MVSASKYTELQSPQLDFYKKLPQRSQFPNHQLGIECRCIIREEHTLNVQVERDFLKEWELSPTITNKVMDDHSRRAREAMEASPLVPVVVASLDFGKYGIMLPLCARNGLITITVTSHHFSLPHPHRSSGQIALPPLPQPCSLETPSSSYSRKRSTWSIMCFFLSRLTIAILVSGICEADAELDIQLQSSGDLRVSPTPPAKSSVGCRGCLSGR